MRLTWSNSAFFASILVLFSGMVGPCLADPGPSEGELTSLYQQRINKDNQTSVIYYGKEGTTEFHALKKKSCSSVEEKSTTTTCKVRVDITSVGLGRHEVKDIVVLEKNNAGNWTLISGIFN